MIKLIGLIGNHVPRGFGMLVTQKCQYALRAVFALARRDGRGPTKIAQIADEQSIPFRFLEVILSQLKQGGFVESRRGTEGGYFLASRSCDISVGDIVRFIDGPVNQVEEKAVVGGAGAGMPDVFTTVWKQAGDALCEVLNGVTIADLVRREEALGREFVPNYQI